MEAIFLLYLSIIVLLILSFKATNNDLISPSVMMCIMFFFSTTIAIINITNWNIKYYSYYAFILLSTGILTFVFADVIMSYFSLHTKKNHAHTSGFHKINISSWKIFLFLIIGIIAIFLQYKEICRITGISGLSNLSSIISQYTLLVSYSDSLTVSEGMNRYVSQLMKINDVTAYIYIFILINNIIERDKCINNLKYIPSIVIYLLQSIMVGNREFIFRVMCIIIVSTFVLWHKKYGWNKNINFKFIRLGINLVIIMIPIFWFSKDLMGRTTTKSFFDYISFYAGGSIQHFNQYILDPPPHNTVFGEETLSNIYTFLWKLGLCDFHRLNHLEYRALNSSIRGNVYTFFRRLIQDYGVVFMYIITLFIGLFYGYFYHFKLKTNDKSYKTNQQILIYCYLYKVILLSSIEQTIFNVLSFKCIAELILQYLEFWFLTSFIISRDGKVKAIIHR